MNATGTNTLIERYHARVEANLASMWSGRIAVSEYMRRQDALWGEIFDAGEGVAKGVLARLRERQHHLFEAMEGRR